MSVKLYAFTCGTLTGEFAPPRNAASIRAISISAINCA
jgi:hypothetical protein